MQALADGEVATRKSWISYGVLVLFLLAMKLAIAAAGMDVGGFGRDPLLALAAGCVRRWGGGIVRISQCRLRIHVGL